MKFDELYGKLNPEQKEAVDAIEGPVMVVAGPGTGKTHVLALRIANILKETDTDPENILALTFTEGAASEMRRRLLDVIGPAAYRLAIFTFHGFCNEVIKSHPEDFADVLGSIPVGDADRWRVAEGVLEKGFAVLRPLGNPSYYIGPLLSAVSDLKREGIGEKEFSVLVEKEAEDLASESAPGTKYKDLERRIEQNRELALFYKLYEVSLKERGFYDYDDMILKVVEELNRNEELLRSLQETYHYVLADEHQDVNNGQNKVLEMLCSYHDSPNLFIVGDEKQAIFRFQGASLENFRYFRKKYPKAKTVFLRKNYRSHQNVLDIASSLMGEKPGTLEAQNQAEKNKIKIWAFENPEEELLFLARAIKKKIDAGVEPSEIAVLVRENKDAKQVATALQKTGIPFVLESDEDLLEDEDIKKFLSILELFGDFGNEELLVPVLHVDFLGVDLLAVYSIFSRARKKGISAFAEFRRAAPDIYETLLRLAQKSSFASLLDILEETARETGFLAYLLKKEGQEEEKMEKTRRLFQNIRALLGEKKQYLLSDFLSYLPVLKDRGISLKKGSVSARKGVRVLTVHRAKGREFSFVYVARAVQGKWGGRRTHRSFHLPESAMPDGKTQEDEEERKLLYVALTRAKKELSITYSKENEEGREQLPSRFLQELDSALTDRAEGLSAAGEKSGIGPASAMSFFLAHAPHPGPSLKEKEFLNQLFLEKGFSVTALNNYLSCPWRYFYMNLVRIPSVQTVLQRYGTAAHAALKIFFDEFRKQGASKSSLIVAFEQELSRQMMTTEEYGRVLAKGKKALAGYYDFYSDTWEKNIFNEFKVVEAVVAPNLRLTGSVDKIEIVSAGEVNAVDYKTRTPLSRNHIEGKTKASSGDYKRQLVFYKILLDKYWDGKYTVRSGEIDFIEPNERGIYKKEKFSLENPEAKALLELIKKTSEEILSLSFWDTMCKDKACKYCALQKSIRSDRNLRV
ncbi:MAG: ATP-dependent helicase [Candidatus Wildermuthbacteria bacterium]|nr:ATP-dependent helicase [Candidatus Wildermuthbacteria bacterium]